MFLNVGQTRLFCLIVFFSQCQDKYSTNLAIIEIGIDGVLWIHTWAGRIIGTDESTEPWIFNTETISILSFFANGKFSFSKHYNN